MEFQNLTDSLNAGSLYVQYTLEHKRQNVSKAPEGFKALPRRHGGSKGDVRWLCLNRGPANESNVTWPALSTILATRCQNSKPSVAISQLIKHIVRLCLDKDAVGLPWPYRFARIMIQTIKAVGGTLKYLDKASLCQPN